MKANTLPQIFIVEDVDSMRELLVQVLTGLSSCAVSGSAGGGLEARRKILRNRPDLILLDEVLPGESSHDLLAEWVSQGIAVLLITSLSQPEPGLPPGALGRISKPGWKSLAEDRRRIESEVLAALGLARKAP